MEAPNDRSASPDTQSVLNGKQEDIDSSASVPVPEHISAPRAALSDPESITLSVLDPTAPRFLPGRRTIDGRSLQEFPTELIHQICEFLDQGNLAELRCTSEY